MKRLNKKITTFLLAGVCVASLGLATVNVVSSADEATAKTYELKSVFTDNGVLGSKKLGSDAKETATFTLGNDQYVRIKRSLAFKWFEDDGNGVGEAKYLNMKFGFEELNFKSVTFKVESESSVASEDDKAVNVVKFTHDGTTISATVNPDEEGAVAVPLTGAAKDDLTLSLAEGSDFDTFKVKINDIEIGEFVNVGGNYAKYKNDGDEASQYIRPLEITTEMEESAKAVVYLKELNKQSFQNIESGKVTDTAAPILVVNEDVTGFQYGTAFSLAYEKIDVLQSSGLTETKKYYQWNPADNKVSYDDTLSTSTYFMDSVYYTKADGTGYSAKKTSEYTKATSVRLQNNGEEYVSVQFTLEDDSKNTTKYDLVWYVDTAQHTNVVKNLPLTNEGTTTNTDYIVVNENKDGATYNFITLDDVNAVNVKDAALDAMIADDYQPLLEKTAAKISAGSDSKLTIPAVDWLIKDNGGYRGLKFTISYKTPSSSSPKTASGLSYNSLRFATTEEGDYEYKIFANDRAGNAMKYYLDGELVNVTTSNVWDIEEIPSFKFTIADSPIKVEEPSSNTSKKVEKTLDQTYSLSGLTVVGAKNEKSAYALYRLDTTGYKGVAITEKALISVKYEVFESASLQLDKVGTADCPTYFDLYLDVYAEKVAKSLKSDATADEIKAIRNCFKKVEEFNDKIPESASEWSKNNKFKWDASAKSFTTAEEGSYLILADFWEDDYRAERAGAYKVIVADSKVDVIKGESEFAKWVENNVVSVVLFGVAALMLIAIIVLLLIKPSEETLEDVEKNAAEKKAKKAKKAKEPEESVEEAKNADETQGE